MKLSLNLILAPLGLLASAMMAVSVSASCGGDRDAFTDAPTGEFTPSGAPDGGCSYYCSPDLKTVHRRCGAEGSGETVEQCAAGLGCGDGQCVEACRAAEVSKGSSGCAFYAVQPNDEPGNCFAALVANTWEGPATLTGELGGKPIDLSRATYEAKKVGDQTVYTPIEGPLQPGQVAVVFLEEWKLGRPEVPCPAGVTTAVITNAPPCWLCGTRRGEGFRISSSVPISAYTIYPYGGASGHTPTATLLLPVSSWETGYVAVSPTVFDVADWMPSVREGLDHVRVVGPRYLQVVASENDTTVSMRPVADMADGDGVPGTAKDAIQSWKLSRGEVLHLVQPDDLTGSTVTADKPIGLFGGAYCSFVPSTWWACDLMQQQIPPPSQWGHQYAMVPFRPRWSLDGSDDVHRSREPAPYSFVAAVDGTTLIYDPAPPAQAPMTLSAGQAVVFETSEVFTVRSQDAAHPFFAASYMPGATYRSGALAPVPGDPDFVNVVPTDQYLDRYIFFTDFTFAQTTLTVVRRRSAKGFSPVVLECAGELTDFRPLGTAGEYEYAWVLLTSSFRPQKFGDKECGYGRHEIHSDSPFEVTVWGTDYFASYGFPGGMGLRPISPVTPSIPH